jgi:CBS domain-containing protein
MQKVKDVIQRENILLHTKDKVSDALQLMKDKCVNGAPVVDEEGKLSGMIVKADIYRFMMDPGHLLSYTLDLVMTKNVVFARPEDTLPRVAQIISDKDVIALPIVDEDNIVIGMITIQDLLKAFIQNCKEMH